MGTKNNPGSYGCYGKAGLDEPMFILLGRDPHAPHTVEKWAQLREDAINDGRKPESDRPMVEEARSCANNMRAFRNRRIATLSAPRRAQPKGSPK